MGFRQLPPCLIVLLTEIFSCNYERHLSGNEAGVTQPLPTHRSAFLELTLETFSSHMNIPMRLRNSFLTYIVWQTVNKTVIGRLTVQIGSSNRFKVYVGKFSDRILAMKQTELTVCPTVRGSLYWIKRRTSKCDTMNHLSCCNERNWHFFVLRSLA